MVVLYNRKEDCCGCTACMNMCPEKAIEMLPDENGFLYPKINDSKCNDCGLCEKVCAFQDNAKPLGHPIATYAAINRNEAVLKKSSSGGVFAALASITLKNNGVIFGSLFNDYLIAEHVCADNLEMIRKMQGSKYVQSNIGNSFNEALQYLQKGRHVLFTGTPCQIDSLKRYLGNDYENLTTVDFICHGVPSPLLLSSYLIFLEQKLKGKIIDFRFRDKTKPGLAIIGRCKYLKNRSHCEMAIYPMLHAYYYYFHAGAILRDCCYNCKYSSIYRPADFSLGDYWGIEKAHPEINAEKGISVMIINSAKAAILIKDVRKHLDLTESTVEKASANNRNLLQPTPKHIERETILRVFRTNGYEAVDAYFRKTLGIKILLFKINTLFPTRLKNRIKRMLKY